MTPSNNTTLSPCNMQTWCEKQLRNRWTKHQQRKAFVPAFYQVAQQAPCLSPHLLLRSQRPALGGRQALGIPHPRAEVVEVHGEDFRLRRSIDMPIRS